MGSSQNRFTFLAVAVIAAVVTVMAGPSLSAQSLARTPEGRPDLQGMWLNNTATPLERPEGFADKAFFTDDEAREYEKHYMLDLAVAFARSIDSPFELEVCTDIDVVEPGHVLPNRRTSLIIDPTNGQVPALIPERQRLLTDRSQYRKAHYGENPEDLPNSERCLFMGSTGPPMLPDIYNNNVQIVQTGDYVMILREMIHDARVIPLEGRAHLPVNIRQWKGNSVGRWEGDTLVVDTTNFTEKTTLNGSGSMLHVIERFTLSDPDTLTYRFTIDDPASFVRSWSGESVMSRTDNLMFEFACHEGNYSMFNVLRGARVAERDLLKKD